MFKDGATTLAHHIMKTYDQIIMYKGRSGDSTGGLGYLYFKPPEDPLVSGPRPVLLFFLDGLTTGELILWTKNASVTSVSAQYLIRRKMQRKDKKKIMIDEATSDNIDDDEGEVADNKGASQSTK